MPNKTVQVTLTEHGANCSIDVVPEFDLGEFQGAVVQIEWVIDNTQAPRWGFSQRGPGKPGGIEIHDDTQGRFAHGGKAGKKYTWTRNTRDGQRYKYTVNVVRDDGRTDNKDPFIVNL